MDAGYVAERGESVRNRFEKAFTSTALSFEHVMRLVEGAIRNPLRKHLDDSQIITCISQNDSLAQD